MRMWKRSYLQIKNKGELMRIKRADYLKSAVYEKDYPEILNSVEFAFVGRSNVGKSSLINSLTSRTKLARTSKLRVEHNSLTFLQLIKNSIL